jgi:lipoprotein-releasing system ATP-binding protein
MTSPVVARGLAKTYGSGQAAVPVFSGLSLEIADGEFVAIVGPSGSGKSTLLHLLAGLDSPDAGEVEIDGELLARMSPTALARLRNEKIGFVFQFHHLLPEFSALENVAMPLRLAGVSRKRAEAQAGELLAQVGLSGRAGHRPAEMSGGELQRAAIARAVAARPPILFADEPTGNLDTENAEIVFALLRKLHSERGKSAVLVTHDHDLARRCDKIFSMTRDGVKAGDVREV